MITGKLFALLVGINDYQPPVRKLQGCIHDIELMEKYLETRFAEEERHILILRNEQATYRNVIDRFRDHLSRAGKEDYVLFHYSGHGSCQISAKEFWEEYPRRLDETLVCYDSRQDNGLDLADKELAVLLAEVSRNCPHITVVLDCCHSGSGTREADDFEMLGARFTDSREEGTALESYIDGYYAKRRHNFAIPESSHVLLAACKKDQKAREDKFSGVRHGVFTWHLIHTLQQHKSQISYKDLLMKCRIAIQQRSQNQDPVFEAYQSFNSHWMVFSRESALGAADPTLHYDPVERAWEIHLGLLHGLKNRNRIEIYDAEAQRSLGPGKITAVEFTKSNIETGLALAPERSYRAHILDMPDHPLLIHLAGKPGDCEEFLNYLADKPYLPFGFSRESGRFTYQLNVTPEKLQLKNLETSKTLKELPNRPEVRDKLLEILYCVDRWERMASLENPHSPIAPAEIELVFYTYEGNQLQPCYKLDKNGRPTSEPAENIRLDYRRSESGDEWEDIPYSIRVRNKSGEQLQAFLFYIDPDYKVELYGETTLTPGDQEVMLIRRGSIELGPGIAEETDRFKLIVAGSEVDIDASMFELNCLEDTREALRKAASREIEPTWLAKTLTVHTVRQETRLNPSETKLAEGNIVIKGHPEATANVFLKSASPLQRSSTVESIIPLRFKNVPGMSLLNPGGHRAAGQEVLEFSDIQNSDKINQKNPLEIVLQQELAEDEYILPVTFDGEDFLDAGYSETSPGLNKVTIRLDKLPDISDDNRRSLTKSLKLCFYKLVLKRPYVNKLCRVEYREDGSVSRSEYGVAEKVKEAQNILLLLHGLLGDTENIATGIMEPLENGLSPFGKAYDLVLAYDYENLHEEMEKTAAELKEALKKSGIHESGDKKITILAHSMGGLVARCLIEQLNGNRFVKHLVMAGAPNDGSKFGDFPSYRDLAITLLSLSMTFNLVAIPHAAMLIAALSQSKKLTRTLEQMRQGSEFLNRLNSGADPGIPYTVIAGDTREYRLKDRRPWKELKEKFVLGIGDIVYGNTAHDIAVSTGSILEVGGQYKTAPRKRTISCHHLNYFTDAGAREVLAGIPILKID